MRKMLFTAIAIGLFAALPGHHASAALSAAQVRLAPSPATVILADYMHNHHRWHHRRRYHGRWQYWD